MKISFVKIFIGIFISVVVLSCAWIWHYSEWYGFNVLLHRGGSFFVNVKDDDKRLSPAMREALKIPEKTFTHGELIWKKIAEGYETSELPVMVDGKEIDTIYLNRIDPKNFKFEVYNEPTGRTGIDEWEKRIPDAVFITNGSYFDKKGKPFTPFISNNVNLGPKNYDAKAGAFIVKNGVPNIINLQDKDWKKEIEGAEQAMVSYPLLIGEDGQNHVNVKSRWLANRTFVAIDKDGFIIIGNTKDAFFSIYNLAQFLKDSPLNLKIALNLDGGPVSCSSLRLGETKIKRYAIWESRIDEKNQVQILTWPIKTSNYGLAIAFVVKKK